MERTYWNGNGAEQEKYNELVKAEENGYTMTKQTQTIFHSYYRYFNDGDFPGWARKDWTIQRLGRWGWELNLKGLEAQEKRVTEAIIKEHARMLKKLGA